MRPVEKDLVEALIAANRPEPPNRRVRYRDLSVVTVLASWNEAGKVGSAVEKVPRDVVDQVVVVDNGSVDETGTEAAEAGAIVLRHPWNAGAGGGYRTGFWYGLVNDYDVIVEIAGDDQDDPSEIPSVVDKLVDDRLDYVQGSRWLTGGSAVSMTASRTFATKFYSWMVSRLYAQRVTDATNGFRAFRTEILDDPRIDLWQDWLIGYELEPYLLLKTISCGYRYGEAPVTKIYHESMADNTKMTPIKGWYSIMRPVALLKLGTRK